MKLIFKVSLKKDCSIASFIKEVNEIPCRICIDLRNNNVTVENINAAMIDSVIELIDNYYTILEVNIENALEEAIPKQQSVPTTDETIEETVNDTVEPKAEAKEVLPIPKKMGTEETALQEVIGFALDKLDASKKMEDQAASFLDDIGMTSTEGMVTKSFVIAGYISKINYENVCLELQKDFPETDKEKIRSILKETFKNWLEKYPSLAEKCPNISFITLLKLFTKKYKSTQKSAN